MPPLPFLVHLVFHPQSDEARALAHAFHAALNSDPLLPGLRVPTAMLPERDDWRPPPRLELSESEGALVVVFADDVLQADDIPSAGGRTWAEFVADTFDACDPAQQRLVPVQVSEHAWPLDARLEHVNFLRAWRKDPAQRSAWVVRHLVIECCRFLCRKDSGLKAPVQLFLSHAKSDIDAEPKVFERVVEHLKITEPVESWVDSAKIAPGDPFGDEILEGLEHSAVLVLLTSSYSSRPWCRREVLHAKARGRPIVVVDALQGVEVRSFPYLGNVPVVAWQGDLPEAGVDLLLREFLRIEHTRLVLQARMQADDVAMPSPPELLTLAQVERGKRVLYPDPPLSDEEAAALAPLGVELSTPLQRAGGRRALTGLRIGLSISPSEDICRHGLQRAHLDAALRDVSQHLLARGATLAYGGRLDLDSSYVRALADLVAAHRAGATHPKAERIVNYIGWPLSVPIKERAELRLAVQFERLPRPDGLADLDPATFTAEPQPFEADTPARRYAWARGMTQMREREARDVAAQVVFGGKLGPGRSAPDAGNPKAWYLGRMPGVLEEVFEVVRADKPLYLSGAFGGAAALAIELIEGGQPDAFTWDYQQRAPHSEAMRELYVQRHQPWIDYPEMRNALAAHGLAGLARDNGLSVEENRDLFVSRDPLRIVELVLAGLTNVAAGKG